MQISTILLTAALLAVPAAAPAARAQSPEATMDRAAKAWAKVKTARATFDQMVSNPMTGTTANAKGELFMQRPGRFSLRFTDPAGDRIVGDGTFTWVYLPSTNPGQVIKLPSGTPGTNGPDIVHELLDAPRAKYTMRGAGTATIGGRKTTAVLLTPKQPTQFTKATVWIDDADGAIRQFELTEASGLVRRVRLTSLALNKPVPASAFTFTPPKGVRVLDQRALGGG